MENDTPEQSLCLSCGICCDGTLFGKVPLKDDDDLLPLQKFGIEISSNGEKKSFKLGCAGFKENCCQLYLDRPKICRSFRCDMLRSFEKGDISRIDAQNKVLRVQKLRENLRKEILKTLPEYKDLSAPALYRIAPKHEELLENKVLLNKWANILMNISLLFYYLQTDFYFKIKDEEKDID